MKLQEPSKGDEPYVFVCYSHENEKVVFAEIEWLQSQGVRVWYDAGISAGAVWREEIADAIRGASQFLYFVSAGSIRSDHCSREVHFALDKELPVLPIYLQSVELPGELDLALARVQALSRSDPEWRRKVLAAIVGSTGDSAPQLPAARNSGGTVVRW